MIIPITEQEIKKGDIVINIRSIEEKFFIIPPGHEFKIINCDKKYGYYVGIDLVENFEIKLYTNCITKKIDLKTAEKEFIFKKETIEYKKYIETECPYTRKKYDYHDRDSYIACSLKVGQYCGYCNPELSCAKYLTQDQIKKSKELVKHLRFNKISELENIKKE